MHFRTAAAAALAACVLMGVPGGAAAQAPAAVTAPADERTALATELAGLVRIDDPAPMMTAMLDMMWSAFATALPGADPAVQAELRTYLVDGLTPIMTAMMDEVGTASFAELAAALAEALTPDEMRIAIAFYGSEAGQRFVNATPQVNQLVLEMATGQHEIEGLDEDEEDAVAFATVNALLAARGLAILPLPEGVGAPAAEPPPAAMTEAAIAARVLLPFTPEMLDDLAGQGALEFVDAFIEAHAGDLPADPALRQELTDALDLAIGRLYRAQAARLLDEMAIRYATILGPDGVAMAVAFITAPETAALRNRLDLVAQQQNDRNRAALQARLPAMMAQMMPVMQGMNAILVRHGLAPLPL